MAVFGDNQCWSWVHFNHSNTIQSDYNISSVSHIGTGFYAIFIDNDAPTGSYCILGNGQWDSTAPNNVSNFGSYGNAQHSTSRFDCANVNPGSQAKFNGNTGMFAAIFSTD